jgi:putative ABC transport system permease protein
MFDRWQEILETLARNKLRTALTALSVAWGIFMLVVLLGAGRGLHNGATHGFRDDATSSIWIFPSVTSLPHEGHAPGRQIRLRNGDHDALAARLPQIEHITSRYGLFGEFSVRRGDRASSFDVRACHPAHRYLENTQITAGRFLNELDMRERRKVAVIGVKVAEYLFGKADPLGQYIEIAGGQYQVIGVFADEGNEGEQRQIYIPLSVAQTLHGAGDEVHRIMFTLADVDVAGSKRAEETTRRLLAGRHHFDPADPRALHLRNNLEMFTRVTGTLDMIQLFIWLVGAGTILAGIVGVSNIMLISVKERTREIGVRKALGAPPAAVVRMILEESVLVTLVSGYLGLLCGVLLVELAARHGPQSDYFRDPRVDFGAAIAATLLLVVCGALAGLFPALRAARIHPIAALREE